MSRQSPGCSPTACAHRAASSDVVRDESGDAVADARTVDPVGSDEMIARLYDVRDIVAPVPRVPGHDGGCDPTGELTEEETAPR